MIKFVRRQMQISIEKNIENMEKYDVLRDLRHCLTLELGLALNSLPCGASFFSMFNSMIHNDVWEV